MISEKDLADKLADTLVQPVAEYAGRVYWVLEKQYKFLRRKYLEEQEYKRESYIFYQDLIQFVEKNFGPFEFKLHEYLSYLLINENLKYLSETGGAGLEHDKIREILLWYSKGYDVKYMQWHEIDPSNFGTIEVKACITNKNKPSEVSLSFDWLKGKLASAGEIMARSKLAEEISAEFKEKGRRQPVALVEKKEEESSAIPLQKIRWNRERKYLLNIFIGMRDATEIDTRENILSASLTQIDNLIDGNFGFTDEEEENPMAYLDPKIIYYGDLAPFIRLLYYLCHTKKNDRYNMMGSKAHIVAFLTGNFLWYDKDEKRINPIKVKTVSDVWNHTDKQYKNNTKQLLADEAEPHKEKRSLIQTLSSQIKALT